MSRKGGNHFHKVTQGAISLNKLEELFPKESRQEVTQPQADKPMAPVLPPALADLVKYHGLQNGSVEVLSRKPWLEKPLLALYVNPETNAKVSKIEDWGGSAVLTIKSSRAHKDKACVEVSEGGDIRVEREPQSEILKQAVRLMRDEAPKPNRQGYRPGDIDEAFRLLIQYARQHVL